jgi:hypothetical protein
MVAQAALAARDPSKAQGVPLDDWQKIVHAWGLLFFASSSLVISAKVF